MKTRKYSAMAQAAAAAGMRPVSRFKVRVENDGSQTRVGLVDGPGGLLGALLARSEASRKVAGVPVPPQVVEAMRTVENFVASLPEDGHD